MISLNSLITGNKYTRQYLAELWNYKSYQAIARGIVASNDSDKIILFVTQDNVPTISQYQNYYDIKNNLLFMDGENSHLRDKKLINSALSNDKIYLFYRKKDHMPYIYYGQVYLASYKLNSNKPSKFIFSTDKFIAESFNESCCNNEGSTFIPNEEGKEKIVQHKIYERNLKNRTEAIKIHGINCSICGFNFNDFYGKDLAMDYIEIHHINPLYNNSGIVNPKTDLIPVCANCHRMLHKNKNNVMKIEDLKKIIKKKTS